MTTVLQTLSLRAYRGISDLTLTDLAPVSLIVGANNAGKSSILEAAGLLLRPPDPAQWVSAVRHRDADMPLIDGLWGLFPGAEALHPEDGPQQSRAIILEGSTSGGPRRVEARCTVTPTWVASAEDPSEPIKTGVQSPTRDERDLPELSARVEVSVGGDPALVLKFPSPTMLAHEVPMFRVFAATPATHYATTTMVEHLSAVVAQGKKQLAVQLLQIFDSDVEDLDVIASGTRKVVYVTHRTRGVVDLSSFGDGMRRSVALSLALARASQGVLLVDEIEAGIHPKVLRDVLGKLLAAASASAVQVIATTHSLEAIDAIIGGAEEMDAGASLAAFWLKRVDGTRQARRYDFDKLCRLREGGLDIR